MHRFKSWSLWGAVVALFVCIGWFIGSSTTTFVDAKGLSYFSNSPEACANCHVMNDVYKKWSNGPHHHVAVCNDCHTPHDFIGKWMTKADNGLHHSLAFTFKKELPIVFEAKEKSKQIVQDNCVRCHSGIAEHPAGLSNNQESLKCISCHKNPAH